jgi:hypothetical protein
VEDRATRACAELYLQEKCPSLRPLDLSRRWDVQSNAIVIWLQCANLFELLHHCRSDLIVDQLKPDGLAIDNKEALLTALAPEKHQQGEVALYLIARTLLPIREWGPKLWLKYVPSWILSTPIAEAEIHASIQTACESNGIRTYGDYLSRETYAVLGIGPAFGRTIFSGIDRACLKEAKTEAELLAMVRERVFLDRVRDAINGLRVRQRDFEIIVDRLGADGQEPHSSAMVMDKFQLSRERVRQIEVRAWKRVLREAWADFFVTRIVELLAQNDGLIPLRALEMIEPWFEGVTDVPAFFDQVLRRMPWPAGWGCSVQRLPAGHALVALSGTAFGVFAKAAHGRRRTANVTMLAALRSVPPAFDRKYAAMTGDWQGSRSRPTGPVTKHE